ncbi:MAG: glycosyltransferase family 2 protein [Candidatus Komeilibacteria bacterium]|nr:glycosyltransferase family 2 protein [Candidatus Komeilibacteria bacterium]
MPKLSIIILNYKNKGLIKNLIQYLLEVSQAIPFEIIVVDNNSQDSIAADLEKRFANHLNGSIEPRLIFIQTGKNGGYAYGNNQGLKTAKGDYYLILNPDMAIFEDAIKVLYNFMESHLKVGLAGPQLLNADKTIQDSCRRFPDGLLPLARRTIFGRTAWGKKWNNHFLMKDFDHQKNLPVDWLFGAALMVRAGAAREVGLLDDRYFLYMEDLDWCRRFWAKHWEVWYVAEAKLIHFHQRKSDDDLGAFGIFKKSGRIHVASWLKYFWKYLGKPLPKK